MAASTDTGNGPARLQIHTYLRVYDQSVAPISNIMTHVTSSLAFRLPLIRGYTSKESRALVGHSLSHPSIYILETASLLLPIEEQHISLSIIPSRILYT